MALTFTTVDQLIEFLPSEPAFDAESEQWMQVGRLASLLDISTVWLGELRKKFRHAYEYRERGNVWIYTPNWFRLYQFYVRENGS